MPPHTSSRPTQRFARSAPGMPRRRETPRALRCTPIPCWDPECTVLAGRSWTPATKAQRDLDVPARRTSSGLRQVTNSTAPARGGLTTRHRPCRLFVVPGQRIDAPGQVRHGSAQAHAPATLGALNPPGLVYGDHGHQFGKSAQPSGCPQEPQTPAPRTIIGDLARGRGGRGGRWLGRRPRRRA